MSNLIITSNIWDVANSIRVYSVSKRSSRRGSYINCDLSYIPNFTKFVIVLRDRDTPRISDSTTILNILNGGAFTDTRYQLSSIQHYKYNAVTSGDVWLSVKKELQNNVIAVDIIYGMTDIDIDGNESFISNGISVNLCEKASLITPRYVDNISIKSEILSISSHITQLKLTISDSDSVNPSTTPYITNNTTPYEFKISYSTTNYNKQIDSSWTKYNNTYYKILKFSSNVDMVLPLTIIDDTDTVTPLKMLIYNIEYTVKGSTFNINGESVQSFAYGSVSFDTSKFIKELLNQDSGKSITVDSSKLTMTEEIPVPNSVTKKYRYSIGISDVYSTSEAFVNTGTYVSDYYTLENPIYSVAFQVDEYIPNKLDKDIIKYYIQFGNNEWVRISPTTRLVEKDNSVIIPKLLVLDNIGIGSILDSIQELNYNSSIYSFRVKIVMVLPDTEKETRNFKTPIISEYRCVVTDYKTFKG